jgi:hypothetical protein
MSSRFWRSPKPAVTGPGNGSCFDRSTRSERVRTGHAAWRTAADVLDMRVEGIIYSMIDEIMDPDATFPEDCIVYCSRTVGVVVNWASMPW